MNFINKINKYLLEHYPLIWNTRLVWMLGVNIIVHLLFFLIGFSSVNGLADLKEHYKLDNFFFNTSNVYYNVLISIFILLIWIIFYLRNNAFKNLYSIKKGMVFQQFCIVFLIILISTSQFYSFKAGLKIKTRSLYNWQELDRDIKVFNKFSLFLMQEQVKYEIDKKEYPAPFPLKVAVGYDYNLTDNIDTTQAFFKKDGHFLQFYKFNNNSNLETNNSNKTRSAIAFDHYGDRTIIDISEFKEFLNPSLFNYSEEKFNYGQDSLDYKNQLNFYEEILSNKDDVKIKEGLNEVLSLSKKYEIKHNLTIDNWFELIDNKPSYLLTELIHSSNPKVEYYTSVGYEGNNLSSGKDIPYSKSLYFDFNDTDNFFKNVYESYFSGFDVIFMYFIIAFSFCLSILILIFKTTSIKTILLSFVASLVVLVLIVWLMSSSNNLFGYSKYNEYFIMLFISFLIIVFSIFSYILKWKKTVISIFWSLVLFAVPTFFLFAAFSYSRYLKDVYLELNPQNYNYKSNFEIWFQNYGFWAILLVSIITVYVYSLFIRKFKARPE
ncbi:hypothetical protein [Polaribacter atrinae]|uniref:Uncharacterized protein n=1 Tax=Polaribacter atrinae TaxID=1333662 RepID=A0A176TEQ7_9FLAO|nr:hypothetical protein [Polaribacter atrinae]OAD46407.1 hypothetical protein LPB303_02415 [Polaribacter atrinae]